MIRAGTRIYYRQPWTPYDLGSSLAAWWSAKDTFRMVDDGAGVISSWADRRTSLAITAATTARPTFGATSFNSAYPGMTFDGTANTMATTTLTALPTGANAGGIWVVCAPTTSGANAVVASYGGQANATFRQVRKSTVDTAQVGDGATQLSGPAGTFTGNHILSGNWSGTTQNAYLDGTAFSGNPGTIATLNTGTTRLRVGASTAAAAASFFPGVISDVIVISGVLSDANRGRLTAYLAWSVGLQANLSSTQPYRWAPP